MTGSLCALAEFPALAEGHPLRFDKVAVKPWTGPQDGAWECFLWDRTRSCIWRLDADGDLSRFSGQPHSEPVQDPEDGSKDTARFGAVWAMVADRQGGLYLSESGSGMSCLRRMAPDGSVRTLARDTGFLPGKPGKATIGLQASLFLDEGTQTLYGTDWTSSGAIYAFDLATDTGRILFKAPALTLLVGLHQGRLVLESDRGLFSAYDPRTGLSTPLFQDAQLRRFHPGPSLGAVAGLAPNKCGSLGPDRRKRAVGGAGQICVVCGPRQLALVLPDWGLPALAPAAGAGTVESKAAPPEKKD